MRYDEEITRRLDQPRLGSLLAECTPPDGIEIPIDVGTVVIDVRSLRSRLELERVPAPEAERAWAVPLLALVFTTTTVIAGGVWLLSSVG